MRRFFSTLNDVLCGARPRLHQYTAPSPTHACAHARRHNMTLSRPSFQGCSRTFGTDGVP